MYTTQSIRDAGVPALILDFDSKIDDEHFVKPLAKAAAAIVNAGDHELSLHETSVLRFVLGRFYVQCCLLEDAFDDHPRIATVERALRFLETDMSKIPDPDMPSWDRRVIAGDRKNDHRSAVTELCEYDGACLMTYARGGVRRYAVLPDFSSANVAVGIAFSDHDVDLRHLFIEEGNGLDVTHANAQAWLEAEALV